MRKINDTTYEQTGDNRRVVIGGQDESKYIPNINISTWGDEGFLNLNFEQFPMDGAEVVIHEDGDDLEAGVSLAQPLGEIRLRVKSSGNLGFHFQPELTREEVEDGHRRPEKVVGSYAVYINKSNNKYKTGKVAHLFRWKCTDANGDIAWCDHLRIIGDVMIVTLPDEWLKTAAFPVYAGSPATIGFTGVGASTKDLSNFGYAWEITMSEDGDLTDIAAYGISSSADDVTYGVYEDDGVSNAPSTLLKDTGGGATSTSASWHSQSLDSTLSLTNGDRVYLASHNDSDWTQYYDSVASPTDETYRVSAGTYTSGDLSGMPTGWAINSPGANYYKWSAYATYTPSGSGPTITDVNTTESWTDGDTGLVITGTDFV